MYLQSKNDEKKVREKSRLFFTLFIVRLVSVRNGKCQNPFFAHFKQNWKVSDEKKVREKKSAFFTLFI